MGLREDREAKNQEKLEKQQEKRKPKLTYVHGIDGRRYINDKILRNLEGSQGGQTFSSYTSVSNYEANGYLSYEDLVEETERLTLEASGEAQNSFDQFAPPSQQDGIAISHSDPAEIANADLEAAFEKAASLGRTVHATHHDMSLGAFQAQAFNSAPPESRSHGFNETSGSPEVHAEKVTGNIVTTFYDGSQNALPNPQQFAGQGLIQSQNIDWGQPPADPQFADPSQFEPPAQEEQYQQQDQFESEHDYSLENQQASAYASAGIVEKPKQVLGQPSKYGMLADDSDDQQEQKQAVPQEVVPPQPPPPSQHQSALNSPPRPPLGMTVSQTMRALPPPVPIEHKETSEPAQGKAEYNKLLGGLFSSDAPAAEPQTSSTPSSYSAPPEAPQQTVLHTDPPASAPSFNQMIKQAQTGSAQPQAQEQAPQHDDVQAEQHKQDYQSFTPAPLQEMPTYDQVLRQKAQQEQALSDQGQVAAQQEQLQYKMAENVSSPEGEESLAQVQNDYAPPEQVQVEPEASLDQPSVEPSVEHMNTPPAKDSLLDFPTTAETTKPKPKFDRKKPPLPRQKADEIYFEDNATSGKTAIFKMPTEGVVRSSRGTVELLVHKGGRMFRPHYNPVGILLRVDVSDGFALIKGQADKAPWQMTDREGNPLDEDVIHTVAFDKKGNLWYETVTGKKTKFLVDGGVQVTDPNGEKTNL
jgi:hypothetical protein